MNCHKQAMSYAKACKTPIATCVCGGKLVKPTKTYMNISGPMKNVVICEECEMMYGEKA
jgi:hypothetical protein